MEENKNENTQKQYLIIKLDDEMYGIDTMCITDLIRIQKITRIPKSSNPFILGVINLRGEIIPIFSLRKKFGFYEKEYTSSSRMAIIKVKEHLLIGVIFDEVVEVISLDDDLIDKYVTDSQDLKSYVTGIGKVKGELISLLNIIAVFEVKDE